MRDNLWLAIEVFILVLACLNICKNIYGIVKVALTQSGKYSLDIWQKTLLAMSISYILTVSILGF